MKRTQLINIICSLLLALLLILSVMLAALFSATNDGAIHLVVASSGMQKEYDGAPLVAHSYEILAGALKDGHSIIASFSGSQTEVGASENTFSIKIIDSALNDVSSNYEIELIFGKLNVTKKLENGGDKPNSDILLGTSVGGGSLIDIGGRISAIDGAGNGNELCLRVNASKKDTVYLKIKSFGAYTGQAWQEAVAYETLIEETLSASYLSSYAIKDNSSEIHIKSFTNQYFLPYYMSYVNFENAQMQTSDVIYSGDTEEVYSVSYGNFDYSKALSVPYTLQTYERNYRSFVESQYCAVDDETRAYMYQIISTNKLNGNTRLETVLKVAKFIQDSAQYSLNYDRNLDQEENIAVAFLSDYNEGICQHYASAATLLYRTMGIPARYTIGFVVDTKPGQWVDVKGRSAHAWVEVYINGMGWVMVEVTNGFGGPNQTQEFEYTAQVTPVYTDKKYDGTPLYAANRVTGFEEFEAMGYTYTAAINGSRTELGKSNSMIESFTVYDRNGKDVTKKFNVTFLPGTVHVYHSELIFTSESATKIYDGTTLSTDISSCKLVEGSLREGDEFYIYYPYSITNVSSGSANFEVVLTDQYGNLVNNLYKVTKFCGRLTITPREITIKAADATKVYDNRPLSRYSYAITDGYLADGDFIYICQVSGTQYGIGRSDNVITSVMIMNRFGIMVTNNYIINLVPGTLEIVPQSQETPVLPWD